MACELTIHLVSWMLSMRLYLLQRLFQRVCHHSQCLHDCNEHMCHQYTWWSLESGPSSLRGCGGHTSMMHTTYRHHTEIYLRQGPSDLFNMVRVTFGHRVRVLLLHKRPRLVRCNCLGTVHICAGVDIYAMMHAWSPFHFFNASPGSSLRPFNTKANIHVPLTHSRSQRLPLATITFSAFPLQVFHMPSPRIHTIYIGELETCLTFESQMQLFWFLPTDFLSECLLDGLH
jgi:hypothetical protein